MQIVEVNSYLSYIIKQLWSVPYQRKLSERNYFARLV